MVCTTAALVGIGLGLAWVALLVRAHRMGRDFPELAADADVSGAGAPPRISVIIACKDEERDIEACVRSVFDQDYPDLEVVVVDDRSTDGTRAVLDRLRDELGPRLRVSSVDELPPGWGGQCHALHVGVTSSTGAWLCFTDADCQLDARTTLSVAWADIDAHRADMLSILPRMDAPTPWEKIYLPLCSFVLLSRLRIADVNDPSSTAAYANGAFLLVRRDTYADLGGHERVRGYVNDDVRLAQLAKQAGARIRVVSNRDLVRTRMYASPRAAWHGWSRNFYGTLRSARNLQRAVAFAAGLFVLPWLGLAATCALAAWVDPGYRAAALAWAVPVGVSHLGLARLYRAFCVGAAWSLAYLPGAVFVTAILANAAGRARRRAGTTWHGVHYDHPA